MRYRLAFFDIDGTLCDPGDGITDAVAHALAGAGIEETDQAALRRFVGPPLEHGFRDYYGMGPDAVTAAVAAYRARYAEHGLGVYRAYPGVADMLRRLGDEGVRLGVVTAKLQGFAEEALRSTGLLGLVQTVHGRAPDGVVEKQVTLGEALAGAGADPARTVMVGDREHDVLAARHHGVDAVGVLWGFGTREELLAAGAPRLAAGPDEVARLVLGGPRPD